MTKNLVLAAFILACAQAAGASTISGDYLESRTADVWTGPCFANGEVNLAGKDAILAWHVRDGRWDGVSLEGLSVVAVLRAHATLGDPHAVAQPVRSVLLVDEKGTAAQRRALESLARSLGGELVGDVAHVDAVPISMETTGHGHAALTAGTVVELSTRCLHDGDKHCGNEDVFYPPLTADAKATPALAVAQSFHGEGLGVTWSCPRKRSAFVGTFER